MMNVFFALATVEEVEIKGAFHSYMNQENETEAQMEAKQKWRYCRRSERCFSSHLSFLYRIKLV